MDPFVLLGFVLLGALSLFAAGLGGLQVWSSDRQWVGVWRGHRVWVRHLRGEVVVEADGEVALAQVRWPLRRSHTSAWSHAGLGDTTVDITRLYIGGNGEYNLSLSIGDERVPLVEVEREWRGARMLLGLQTADPGAAEAYWKSMVPATVEPLGDDRWIAACRLLDLARQSFAMTDDMRESANRLQAVLRRSFEARQRLGDEALEVLGAGSAAEVATVQEALEGRIVSALDAVKSLHMAVVSIESRADETVELQRVQQTLDSLQANDEVDRFMKRHAAQRATEGPPRA